MSHLTVENKRAILVVNDIEATRRSIKQMLEQDGYRVLTVRDEADAAEKRGCLKKIDLILITLEGKIEKIIRAAKRIRKLAAASESVPIVIFCDGESAADQLAFEPNVYFSCPDDFNQLRKFIGRLLASFQEAAQI